MENDISVGSSVVEIRHVEWLADQGTNFHVDEGFGMVGEVL